jgi:glutamate--cysteine ligase catalytic subunit
MSLRRKQIQDLLEDDEYPVSLTSFPFLGCLNYTWPNYKPTPGTGVTSSLFYVDQAVFSGHPRFAALTRNIRNRRGRKVIINVPIYVDKNTPQPFNEDLSQYMNGDDSDNESKLAAKENHIYMDVIKVITRFFK